MQNLKKITLYTVCFFYLLLASSSTSAQHNTLKLQLKWWHQFQFAGFYAADIKGFYKNEGLQVTLIPGDKEHPPVAEVVAGRADYGVTGSELILDFAQGKPVQALGIIFQHSPHVIISLEKSGISTPADLRGKKIMASKDQGWIQLQAALMMEGISPDSVTIIEHTWNNNDLINGTADAMSGYTSAEPFQLEKMGYPTHKMYPKNYGIDFYGDLLFSTRKTVQQYPERTDKFLRASFKGWEYAMNHPGELADYILTLPGVKERKVTKEELLLEANEIAKLMLPQLVEIGHMNTGRWQHILDVYKKLELIPRQQELEGFVYSPNEVSESRLQKIIFYILAAVAVLFGIGILYAFSLKKAVAHRTIELEKEISIRKHNEAALSSLSAELKGSNNDLVQFAYLTSHNLRAPVSNLLSLVQLFDRTNLSPKNAQYVEKMSSSVVALNNTLNSLNEILSARNRKQDDSDLQALHFETILQQVLDAMRDSIQQSKTTVQFDFSRAPQLVSSRALLQNIFIDLLNHAITSAAPGIAPNLSIRSYSHQQGNIQLEFSDNINSNAVKEGQHKLFSMVQRLNTHTAGKGLGLYLLNYQVEKNGGNIQVQNNPGKGTVYTISLKDHTAK
jgi:ABC-type nitrate/sulfonate/bicarbonate transport system substrate-binding protein/nitrogen-specific signal transduction histidine kinase